MDSHLVYHLFPVSSTPDIITCNLHVNNTDIVHQILDATNYNLYHLKKFKDRFRKCIPISEMSDVEG